MAATRGIPTWRLNSGVIVKATVEMPFSSSTRATCPTDRQQIGQVGVSKTASTPSSCIRDTTAGTDSSSSSFGYGG